MAFTTSRRRLLAVAALALGLTSIAPTALAARASQGYTGQRCNQSSPESVVAATTGTEVPTAVPLAPVICSTAASSAGRRVVMSAEARAGEDGLGPSSGSALAFGDVQDWFRLKHPARQMRVTFHFSVASAKADVPPEWSAVDGGRSALAGWVISSRSTAIERSAEEIVTDTVFGPRTLANDTVDVVVEVTNGEDLIPAGWYVLTGRAIATAFIGTDVMPSAGSARSSIDATLVGVDVQVTP